MSALFFRGDAPAAQGLALTATALDREGVIYYTDRCKNKHRFLRGENDRVRFKSIKGATFAFFPS